MPYLFATEDQDYSDYASGRVIYSQPGAPAFPVRLASEIFQRALRLLRPTGRLTLYDPTCGGAYHLTALGFLFGGQIGAILGSDVDPRAAALAQRNLGLLSLEGLAQRETELAAMFQQFGKESHAGALRSAQTLRSLLEGHPLIRARIFQANALDPTAISQELTSERIDLVISDIPYGQLSAWQPAPAENHDPILSPAEQMLQALRAVLPAEAVVAIAADKSQKIAHPAYRRLERFQIGHRQVTFLQRADKSV